MSNIKNNQNLLYVFLHIPKTGGITLHYHIEKNFKKNEFLLLYRSANQKLENKQSVDQYILSLSKNQRDKIKIIYGHEVYYGIHELFPDKTVRYITFFRLPLELFFSFYNFFKYKIDHDNKWFKTEGSYFIIKDNNNFDFNKFVVSSDDLDITYQFLAGRLLSGDFGVKCSYPENIDNLKKIEDILNKFYFIGLVEKAEDFLFVYNELGISKFFVNKNKTKKNYLNDRAFENKSKIISKMKFDYQLYDYVSKINNDFKKHNSDFYDLTENKIRPKLIKALYFIPDLLSNMIYNILRKFGLINLINDYVYRRNHNDK